MILPYKDLKDFLDKKVDRYNTPEFIEYDPISIPHNFSSKEDIEISGFLAATIAWGNRKMILKNGNRMMDIMGNSPYEFVMNHSEPDIERFEGFVHRTFNSTDLVYFIGSLKNIYENHNGLEGIFDKYKTGDSLQAAIHMLSCIFFELPHKNRTLRHVSDPFKGSAAKKINMFLRWMVRKDNKSVDFGIWKSISPSILSCPLDVHSGDVARKLGLITRKQNDARALAELDRNLRAFDPEDPAKYDFALFGLGVFENF
jgi:uncharacterized protein (TIGR02757 family)